MRRRGATSCAVGVAVIAIVAFAAPPASAGQRSLQAACFAPDALRARPGEERPQRGDRRFDRLNTGTQSLEPFSPVPANLRGAVRRVELPKGLKLVALTLDLCEQTGEIAGYDGAIIDFLRDSNTRATLFTGGKWIMSHDERARQLLTDPLFEFGSHGWAHRNARGLEGTALRQEIDGPQYAYERLRAKVVTEQCVAADPQTAARIAPRLGLYRFPYGACNAGSLAAVNDSGLVAVQWDVSTGDPAPSQSAAAIADIMVRTTRPGSIILAHANGRGVHTAAALPLAIPRLKAMGYEFVTVSELMAAGRAVVEPRCYDSHPGDTDRYDALFARPPVVATGTPGAPAGSTTGKAAPPVRPAQTKQAAPSEAPSSFWSWLPWNQK